MRRSRSTRRAALLAVLLAAGGGWLAREELYLHGGDRSLAWQDLTPRTRAEPPRADLRVLRTPADVRAEYLRLGAAHLPALDLSRRTAILLATGPRSSTAFGLDVLGVREERSRIVVTVRERTPSLARPGTASLRFPFRLISIERTAKPVALERRGSA